MTTATKKTTLRVLLENLIDYAGLFPPARLDMAQTVRNYAEYVNGDDSWMLGRLIVPAGRLDEFETEARELLPKDGGTQPWRISALTKPAGDNELQANLQRIATFNEKHDSPKQGLARIDVIELKGESADEIDQALGLIPDDLFPFFELPVAEDPRGLITGLAGSEAGAKIRTGGVSADLHPSPEQVARFIVGCAQASVPFKATAGLHHPLRHFAKSVQTEQFGFLNVFTAAALAKALRLDESDLRDVLTDQSIASFAFEDDELQYREHHVDRDQLQEARWTFGISFGSCSFDEPREDLRTLNLI